MNARPDWLRYRTRGGMLSTAELRLLADAATARGTGRIYVTSRQEFALRGLTAQRAAVLLATPAEELNPVAGGVSVTTTAPIAGMPQTREWLSEGIFADILGRITERPSSPVALSDPVQPYLPAVTGAINLLALEQRDLWQVLLVGREDSASITLPGAIRTMDIPDFLQHTSSLDMRVTERMIQDIAGIYEHWRVPHAYAPAQLMRRYAPPPGALSIAIDDGGIPSEFVSALCMAAGRWHGVSFGLTPWSTLLVKGASDQSLIELRTLMMRHGVSEPRTHWRQHLLASESCISLALLICRALEHRCTVRSGHAIAVLDSPSLFPDVHVVVRESANRYWPVPWRGKRFDVLLRQDTASGALAWSCKAAVPLDRVAREVLDALAPPEQARLKPQETTVTNTTARHGNTAAPLARCVHCLTVYDEAYGDARGGVAPGIPFDSLPATWECPVCGAPKGDYETVAQMTSVAT